MQVLLQNAKEMLEEQIKNKKKNDECDSPVRLEQSPLLSMKRAVVVNAFDRIEKFIPRLANHLIKTKTDEFEFWQG